MIFSNVTRIGVPNYYDYRSSHRRVSRLMNIHLAQGPLKFEFSTFSSGEDPDPSRAVQYRMLL